MHENTDSPPVKRPIILLIEEDDNARPSLSNNLRQQGYRLLVAADLADALEWVASTNIPADLVLVDLVGKSPAEALSAGRRLRQHAKYDGHTPLVVLPEKFTKEQEGRDENISGHDWICYFADSDQLHKLLGRLIKKDSTPCHS